MKPTNAKLRFKNYGFPDWKSGLLGELVNEKSPKFNPEKSSENFIGCIELEHIEQNSGRLLGLSNAVNLKSIKNKFQKGDVLFGKMRPYLRKFLHPDFDGVCSTEIWVLKGKDLRNDYLYQLIQTDRFIKATNQSTGSKMPRADWGVVSKIKLLYPSQKEQEKIASFLTLIDQKINLLTQNHELLVTYKKGVMQKIFNQDIRFKDSAGNEDPSWQKILLKDVVRKFIVPMRDKPKSLAGPVPWCRIEDFEGKYLSSSKSGQGVDSETILSMNLKLYPLNTLLVSCSANLGICAIVKTELVTNQTFIGLVPNEQLINIEFLYYLMSLSAPRLNALSSGTTISYLSREKFENFDVLVPCIEEQTKIANFLSAIDEKISNVQKQLELTKQYKQGLLQQMFV
jgi:type I restriction enzyme S subunit